MSFLFGEKKTPAELLREKKWMLEKFIRGIERERQSLQTQEKKLTVEIKKTAKIGQMVCLDSCWSVSALIALIVIHLKFRCHCHIIILISGPMFMAFRQAMLLDCNGRINDINLTGWFLENGWRRIVNMDEENHDAVDPLQTSPHHSPEHLQEDSLGQTPDHIRGESTHHEQQGKNDNEHPSGESPDSSPAHSTEQSLDHSPHHSAAESSRHGPPDSAHQTSGKLSHPSFPVPPDHPPPEYSTLELTDQTAGELTHHSPAVHFDHTTRNPSDNSLRHSPRRSPPYSSQHSSIEVEPSTSYGRHDEEQEVFYGPQMSMLDTILSFVSQSANAVLNVLLPPLPPEPSGAASSEIVRSPQHVSDASHDSNAPRRGGHRGRVGFTGDHDESEVSIASLHEVRETIEDLKRKKSRKISARFFQTPLVPPPKVHTWGETIHIAYQTLGVVYGDLGTSPLYVYPTINVTNPTTEDFLGILSLIFWTLTLIGVLKYSLIVLQADDHGEGGTFAMYSLLCQYANIGQHHGEQSPVQDMAGRRLSHLYKVKEQSKPSRTKVFLENNRKAQKVLLFVVMLGTCMLVGDGILTPAISVISAIEGIQTATPNLSNAVVVVISAVILVLLFLSQRFGTHRVSLFFSPIMAMWLITTPLVGIYNIATYYPGVFKAFSPAHIYYFFRDNGKQAWLMLGGTVLCITGSEAMYADMGHFNKHSIQFAFCVMVYPSVLITYSGQTAYLIAYPQDHSQGFFKMMPKKVIWPMFIVSTLAAIVASQGLISATFSIIKQSVALDYFPRVKLVHTSEHKEGQIYSPEVNYILMILCLAVVFGFRSSATIGNAFGVAVVLVMLITTCLTTLVMLVIWKCRLVVVMGFFFLFFVMEIIYFSAVVTKVPQGGWLPFAVALVVTLIMFTWHLGCQAKYRYEMRNQIPKSSFGTLLQEVGSVRVPGICFFYTDLMSGVPPIVQHYVSNVRSLHHVLVFTTVRFLPVKTVLPAERFLVGRAGFDGVYRCVARYGYRDVMKIQNNEFLDQFLATLTGYIQSNEDSSTPGKSVLSENEEFPHTSGSLDADIKALKQAREDGAVYVMGRGELKASKTTKFMTRIFVGQIYRFLRANCRSEVSTMDIPCAHYLEIGMVYDI